MTDKRKIAEELLRIGAVFLRPDEPFTWASGIKSPIYCDNRLILSEPQARSLIEDSLADIIRERYPETEILMATSTAGIAHAAIAAHLTRMPMGYVRSSSKDHGRRNRIEGRLTSGQKAVVVEDLISTAGSAIETADAVRKAGAEVLGIASIFTYGMKKSTENLEKAGYCNVSLCDLDALCDVACEKGYISSKQMAKVICFRDEPETDLWMKEEW